MGGSGKFYGDTTKMLQSPFPRDKKWLVPLGIVVIAILWKWYYIWRVQI